VAVQSAADDEDEDEIDEVDDELLASIPPSAASRYRRGRFAYNETGGWQRPALLGFLGAASVTGFVLLYYGVKSLVNSQELKDWFTGNPAAVQVAPAVPDKAHVEPPPAPLPNQHDHPVAEAEAETETTDDGKVTAESPDSDTPPDAIPDGEAGR